MGMTAVPEHVPTTEELAELLQPGADWDRDGFHPTMNRPFPSMQCVGVVRSGPRAGERCNNRAIYGATVCLSHGGRLPAVREKAQALVDSARLALVGSADEAVNWLIELGRNSASDAVRLGAAKEVLDRAGVRGGVELDVTVTDRKDPAEVLRQRIAQTRERVQGPVLEGQPGDVSDTVSPTGQPDEEQTP